MSVNHRISPDQAFRQTLDQAIDLTTQLEKLLLEETSTLDGRDPDRLQTLVENKQRVLEQIEQATARLQQLVEAEGHAFTAEGMDAFLGTLPAGSTSATPETAPEATSGNQRATPKETARAGWKRLRELAASCELMNRANAQAVERSRQRVATALKIIRGEEDNGNTYSARGYSQSGAVLGRTLTQA